MGTAAAVVPRSSAAPPSATVAAASDVPNHRWHPSRICSHAGIDQTNDMTLKLYGATGVCRDIGAQRIPPCPDESNDLTGRKKYVYPSPQHPSERGYPNPGASEQPRLR